MMDFNIYPLVIDSKQFFTYTFTKKNDMFRIG